jgi:tetratricopeptide (TPR) repeat protein
MEHKSRNNVEDLIRIAREDISRNSLSSAEKTLEQAILLNNQQPDVFYLLGCVYAKKGKFKKATLAFQKTLNLDPLHTEAAIALSSLYNDVGKYKEGAAVFFNAKKRLDKALPGHDPKINQGLALKHCEVAALYVRFERFQEAYHEFAKALNLEPDNVAYAVQMAKCLAKTGDRLGAIGFLRKTVARHPGHVEAKIQLGILFHSQQMIKEAQKEWQEALVIEPESKLAQMYLSMLDYEPRASSFSV